MEQADILTLGQVALSGDRLQHQHQPIILLAYLSLEGKRDREQLATIFWPTAQKPLNNLSSALTRIRQALPEALDIGPRQISTNVRTDASVALDLLRSGDVSGALNLHNGPFLDGYRLRSIGLELEEWIYETRDRIDATLAQAAIDQSGAMVTRGNITAAADLAERAVAIGGVAQVVLDNAKDLYSLLSGASRLAAQTLKANAEDIGISLAGVQPLRKPEQDLGEQDEMFVGRSEDIAALTAALQPETVVNLWGLAGSGKSTLIQRFLAQSNPSFDGGIHVVSHAVDTDGAHLLHQVKSALAENAAPGRFEDIVDMVEQDTLLVIEDTAVNSDVLRALDTLRVIPKLACIVASRVRIDLPGVVSLPLKGLATSGTVARSDAAELFLRHAEPHLKSNELSADSLAIVDQICDRVQGLPLALALSAAWLRLLPLNELVPLLDDEELWEEPPPGESLALGVVIQRTWDLLERDCQDALQNLSVFRGSFDRLAARDVAGANLRELSRLQSCALLDLTETSRLTVHPLVRQFAASQLALDPQRRDQLVQRHGDYFSEVLQRVADDLVGPDQLRTLERLGEDHENISAAWELFLSSGRWVDIDGALKALEFYLLRSGQFVEGQRLFQETIDAASALDTSDLDEISSLLPRLLNPLAWCQMMMGRDTVALQLCERGLSELETRELDVNDFETRIRLLRTRSAVFINLGRFTEALEGYVKGSAIAAELADALLALVLKEDIGRCHDSLGEYDEAIAVFREVLDHGRRTENPHMEARSYLMLGAATTSSDPARAILLLEEGMAVAQAHNLRHLQAYLLKDRGFAHLAGGNWTQAVEQFVAGTELAQDLGDFSIQLDSTIGHAQALLRHAGIAEARPLTEEAIRLAVRNNRWPSTFGIGMAVANRALLEDPGNESARQIFAFCSSHQLVLHADLVREAHGRDHAAPDKPLPSDVRLDELCEQVLSLVRTL